MRFPASGQVSALHLLQDARDAVPVATFGRVEHRPSLAPAAEPLGRFLGGDVDHVVRLSGGASRETFSFTLATEGSDPPDELILQRVRSGPMAGGFSMEAEGALLRAAAAAGVPVAAVVAASDDVEVVGAPFIVVRRLAGETIARRILRDDAYASARPLLIGQCADALAAVHSIPPDGVTGLTATDQLGSLRALHDMLEPSMGAHPAFELAFRQLERTRPAGRSDVVVHGDFRLGNLIVDATGLVAAIDWELAHLGEPLEDLAWFSIRAWAFGGPGEVAGLGSLDELVAGYESASGTEVDRDALRWWRAVETLRWGVICMLQAHTHLSGASRSVELATIGRRVCETEYDLLRLLR
jgi:aminoglycoside phosphotransferase (APT) family kinase protein